MKKILSPEKSLAIGLVLLFTLEGLVYSQAINYTFNQSAGTYTLVRIF
jgi:hypothetical protein